jgi:hypothetical protein
MDAERLGEDGSRDFGCQRERGGQDDRAAAEAQEDAPRTSPVPS